MRKPIWCLPIWRDEMFFSIPKLCPLFFPHLLRLLQLRLWTITVWFQRSIADGHTHHLLCLHTKYQISDRIKHIDRDNSKYKGHDKPLQLTIIPCITTERKDSRNKPSINKKIKLRTRYIKGENWFVVTLLKLYNVLFHTQIAPRQLSYFL